MPNVNPDLDWALEDLRARLPRYQLYRAYDEGNHRLLFASTKFQDAFGDLFREFADNLCEDVVDSISDRLQVIGWSSGDQTLNATADMLWVRNRGEARTGAVRRNAFREGDGFSIVQMDAQGKARAYRQDPTLMSVRYSTDNPDEKALAAKVWKAQRRYRVNLYYPDRTERYASRGTGADGGLPRAGAFKLLELGDPALAEGEPITAHDLMPVYHYPNGELSGYGRSILRGVIPLQDALNKAIADMLVTMEGHAAPMRWATGIEVEHDPITGKEKEPFRRAHVPGSVMRTGSKDASFGQFDPADLTGFLDVQDQFKIEIARKGVMPPHAVTLRSGSASSPSGISLLVAEGRTIKLAKDRQRDWGVEQRREMAHQIMLELGMADVDPDDLQDEWAPPETRDEKALVEMLLLKLELGVPKRQALLELGYSTDDVDKFLEEEQEAQRTEQDVLSVLEGGRQAVSGTAAGIAASALGLPPAPVPPALIQ